MAGQSANYSVGDVKGAINKIETNNQVSKGKSSGAETNKQLGKSKSMQKKSC